MSSQQKTNLDFFELPPTIAQTLSKLVSRHRGRERYLQWGGIAVFCLAILLTMICVDLIIEIDSTDLRVLGWCFSSCLVAFFAYWWHRNFDTSYGMFNAAWQLETVFPQLDERVTSTVSLTDPSQTSYKASENSGSPQLIAALGRETAEKMAKLDTDLIPIRSNRIITACATLLFSMLLAVAFINPQGSFCSVRNWLLPWLPPIFPLIQVELLPGDVTLVSGEDLNVQAVGLAKNLKAILEYESKNGSNSTPFGQEKTHFAKLIDIRHDTTYRLRIGKRVSRDYYIRVSKPLKSEVVPENNNLPDQEQQLDENREPDALQSDPSFEEISKQQESLQRDLTATQQKIEQAIKLIDQAVPNPSDAASPDSDGKPKANESLIEEARDQAAQSRNMAESLADKIDRSNIDLANSSNELRGLAKEELSNAEHQLDTKELNDSNPNPNEQIAQARQNLEKARGKLDELKKAMDDKQKTLSSAAKLEKISNDQQKLAAEISQENSDQSESDPQSTEPPPGEWSEKQKQTLSELKTLQKTDRTDRTDRTDQLAEACEKCSDAANSATRKQAKKNAQSAADKLSQIIEDLGRKPGLLKNCDKCRNPGDGNSHGKPSSKAGNQPNGTKSVTDLPFERLPLRAGSSSSWTNAKSQRKNSDLDGREALIPDAFRDVVSDYFEALANERSENSTITDKNTPQP